MTIPAKLFDLTGRTALVTGGSRGLGTNFARALASAGASVMIAAHDSNGLERAKRQFERDGIHVTTAAANLADRSEVERLVDSAIKILGHVDILVANAGTALPGPADGFSDAQLDNQMSINLIAPMLLTRLLTPQMKEQKWGRLIYISSVASLVSSGTDGHSIYSATKAGLNGYMRTAAMEFGGYGVTANCIAPGVFLTDMAQSHLDAHGELGKQVYDAHAGMTALGRWGEPSELEGALILLASDAGKYITGSVLVVDGGFSVRSRPA
jgi:NAD(P)-dependent dehydrogenase (short-subunit alcohol dehydrogenase family)